jgi:hypothetical protein
VFKSPRSLRFSIPVDHPRAGRLRALFDALATSQQRLSGLVIESGREDPAAVEHVLGELREILREDGIDLDAILEKELHRKPAASDLQGFLSNPVVLASLMSMGKDVTPPQQDSVVG